jgi:Family of unknown function (DUF6011)
MQAAVDDAAIALPAENRCAVIPSGIYTVRGPRGHRTFRVARRPADASFAPGQRVISLLTGPDRDTDWLQFGFVADGAVRWPINVWRSKRGEGARSELEIYAQLLTHMICGGFRHWRGPDGLVHEYEIMVAVRCARCSRLLTHPESVELGLGPECHKKGRHA